MAVKYIKLKLRRKGRMVGTYKTERLGVAAVASRVADLGQVWRETSTGDFGIDGHIELIGDDDTPTGLMVGVQVKAGASYLSKATPTGFSYSVSEKHQRYWEHYPVPVLLVMHDPTAKLSYWVDVRQEFRSGRTKNRTIVVPKSQIFQETTTEALFANAGIHPEEYVYDTRKLLEILVSTKTNNAGFSISYFDLFCLGMTNICRSLYFGMDLAMKIAEHRLIAAEAEHGWSVGGADYDFIEGYIRFLVSQNLVHANYSDLLIDLELRELVPEFIVPLSKRGRALKDLISVREDELVSNSLLPEGRSRAAQEAFVEINEMSMLPRFSRVAEVANQIQKAMS